MRVVAARRLTLRLRPAYERGPPLRVPDHGLCSPQFPAAERALPGDFLDFDFERGQARRALPAQLGLHLSSHPLREHLGGGIGDGEDQHVLAREDVLLLAELDEDARPLFGEGEVRVVARQQHAMVEPVADAAQNLLQRREVEDVGILVEIAFERGGGAVIVAVQRLAPVVVGDEVPGTEDGVVFGDVDAKGRHKGQGMRPKAQGPRYKAQASRHKAELRSRSAHAYGVAVGEAWPSPPGRSTITLLVMRYQAAIVLKRSLDSVSGPICTPFTRVSTA